MKTLKLKKSLPPRQTKSTASMEVVYLQDTTLCKRQVDLKAVWTEFQVKCKQLLSWRFFYKPFNSKLDYFDLLKECVDRVCYADIGDIMVTVFFIYNMAQHNLSKMKTKCRK